MEVPRRFIDVMMDPSSSGIYWATLKDAAALKEVPSIAEWLSASCGTNSFERAMDELMAGRTDLRDLSARERAKYQTLAKPLAERDNEISSCCIRNLTTLEMPCGSRCSRRFSHSIISSSNAMDREERMHYR